MEMKQNKISQTRDVVLGGYFSNKWINCDSLTCSSIINGVSVGDLDDSQRVYYVHRFRLREILFFFHHDVQLRSSKHKRLFVFCFFSLCINFLISNFCVVIFFRVPLHSSCKFKVK